MTKILEGVALVSLIVMFAVVGLAWPKLPPIIATHFGASGYPDQCGERAFIWVLPAVGLGLYALLTGVSSLVKSSRIGPVDAVQEIRDIAALFVTAIKAFLITAFAYIVWRQSNNADQGLGPFFLPVLLVGPLVMIGWSVLRLRGIIVSGIRS